MKPETPRKGTAGTAPRTNLTKISKQLTEIHLMQAQLNMLNEQVNRPAPWTHVAWSGKSSRERAQGLLTRRAQLSKKLTKAQADYPLRPASVLSPGVEEMLINFADRFFWPRWSTIPVPSMSEGFDQTPAYVGDNYASGDIQAVSLGPGYVVFQGELSDSAQDPSEAWWAHTWACTVTFPHFSAKELMMYRFTVDAALGFYPEWGQPPLPPGNIMEWVSIGTTGDIGTHPISTADVTDLSPWPVNTTIPQGNNMYFGGTVDVSGSMQAGPGTPALVLLFGVAVGFSGGNSLHVFPTVSSFTEHLTRAPYGAADVGKLEYMVPLRWWIEAIEKIPNAAIQMP
jgi:hypothetical protein